MNAIELLPVFEFNELEYYSPIPGSPTNEHRFNFWGYSTGAACSVRYTPLRLHLAHCLPRTACVAELWEHMIEHALRQLCMPGAAPMMYLLAAPQRQVVWLACSPLRGAWCTAAAIV